MSNKPQDIILFRHDRKKHKSFAVFGKRYIRGFVFKWIKQPKGGFDGSVGMRYTDYSIVLQIGRFYVSYNRTMKD